MAPLLGVVGIRAHRQAVRRRRRGTLDRRHAGRAAARCSVVEGDLGAPRGR
jgi:hypothetical protein